MRRVALLSSGAVDGGDEANAVVAMNAASERAVRVSGLRWTILRASGFQSNALRWLSQLAGGDVVRDPFPEVPIALVDPADLGAAAVTALQGHHDDETLRLTGPEALRPAEQVAADATRPPRGRAGRLGRPPRGALPLIRMTLRERERPALGES
jgi:uncharacterized protein YbjT (DUF2867 family)